MFVRSEILASTWKNIRDSGIGGKIFLVVV